MKRNPTDLMVAACFVVWRLIRLRWDKKFTAEDVDQLSAINDTLRAMNFGGYDISPSINSSTCPVKLQTPTPAPAKPEPKFKPKPEFKHELPRWFWIVLHIALAIVAAVGVHLVWLSLK